MVPDRCTSCCTLRRADSPKSLLARVVGPGEDQTRLAMLAVDLWPRSRQPAPEAIGDCWGNRVARAPFFGDPVDLSQQGPRYQLWGAVLSKLMIVGVLL